MVNSFREHNFLFGMNAIEFEMALALLEAEAESINGKISRVKIK